MKYRIYGQFTGNIGDKSESIPWPFISIRATCVSSAWRITRTINTKPWWKWCCATRIPSRGSDCSAITSRGSRQRRPWRPAWPVKAWRSLSTRGWSKHPASVPPVKPPCGWKNGGTGIPPVKLDLHNQIRCLSDRYRYRNVIICALVQCWFGVTGRAVGLMVNAPLSDAKSLTASNTESVNWPLSRLQFESKQIT